MDVSGLLVEDVVTTPGAVVHYWVLHYTQFSKMDRSPGTFSVNFKTFKSLTDLIKERTPLKTSLLNELKFKTLIFHSCKCFAGLAGPKCDQVDNPCLPNPCHNEARCTPEMLRDPKNVTAVEDEAIYGKFKCR